MLGLNRGGFRFSLGILRSLERFLFRSRRWCRIHRCELCFLRRGSQIRNCSARADRGLWHSQKQKAGGRAEQKACPEASLPRQSAQKPSRTPWESRAESLPRRQPIAKPTKTPAQKPSRKLWEQPSREPSQSLSGQPAQKPSRTPCKRPSRKPTETPTLRKAYRDTCAKAKQKALEKSQAESLRKAYQGYWIIFPEPIKHPCKIFDFY